MHGCTYPLISAFSADADITVDARNTEHGVVITGSISGSGK